MPRAPEYFPQLTGVRALAAWSVFNYHFNSFSPAIVGDWIYRFTEEMYLGVNVFYVLSGFLIYYRYESQLVAGNRVALGTYILNRFARIYPVYWLLLLAGYLARGFPDPLTCLATLTLTHAFFPSLVHAGIPQAWTLTIEETFYFSAPLLFRSVRRIGVLITCALVAALGLLLPVAGIGTVDHLIGRTLCGAIGCFGCGMALARVYGQRGGRPAFGTRPWLTYGGLALSALLVLAMSRLSLLAEAGLPPGELRHGRDHGLGALAMFTIFPALVAILFYGLMTERSWLATWLRSRTFVLLGGASYSFYLLHKGDLQEIWFENVSANYLVAFVACNLLAIGLFLLYEKPLARWIRSAAGKGNVDAPVYAGANSGESVTPSPVSDTPTEGQTLRWPGPLVWGVYTALALVVAAVEFVPRIVARNGGELTAALWMIEDGPYESLEAILCAAAAAMFFAAAWFTVRGTEVDEAAPQSKRSVVLARWRCGWLIALGAMLTAMLCAELSFGQRLFGFGTPQWLRSRNYQGEFSFHNLLVFQSSDEGNRLQNAWLLSMLLYLGVLPIASRAWARLGAVLARVALPVASLPVAMLFLGELLLFAALPPYSSETLELVIDVLLVALAAEALLVTGEAETATAARRWGFGAAVAVAAPLAILLVAFSGRHQLPTARSQAMVPQALQMASRNDLAGARAKLEEAIELWPRNAEAHYELARVLASEGDTPGAVQHLERAVELRVTDPEWRLALGMLLAKEGRVADAIPQLREVLTVAPDSPNVQTYLAWLLATSPDDSLRNGAEAVRLAEAAEQQLGDSQIFTLDVLAAAYAEAGRFDEAVEVARRAIDAAIATQNVGLAAEVRERQRLYQNRQPYRMPRQGSAAAPNAPR
ncbi:MAG: acyltransferase family protein [Pirellulales bacterium]